MPTLTRIPEADLTREAANAGTAYIEAKYPLPHDITERAIAVNSCAHGFYMGVRWLEAQQSNTVPAGDVALAEIIPVTEAGDPQP